MTEPDPEGPPDPQLDPTVSPGFDGEIESLEEIEVGRDDITIGEATPAEMAAADTSPVANDSVRELLATLENGSVADRRRVVLALGEREPTQPAVAALVDAALGDPDADVRQFAVETLGELDPPSLPEVARAALTDENPWVRAEAVVVLDHHDRETHEDVLESRLDDDHHAVRRNALVSLAKHRGADMLATLCSMADDDSERVREWVAEFLGDIDDERAEAALGTLTDDDSDIVAEAAAHALDGDGDRRELFVDSTTATDPAGRTTPPDL